MFSSSRYSINPYASLRITRSPKMLQNVDIIYSALLCIPVRKICSIANPS